MKFQNLLVFSFILSVSADAAERRRPKESKPAPSKLSSLESQFQSGGISFGPSGKVNFTSDWTPTKSDDKLVLSRTEFGDYKFQATYDENGKINNVSSMQFSGLFPTWNARVENNEIQSFTQCGDENLVFPHCVTINGELCRMLLKESKSKDYAELANKAEACENIANVVDPPASDEADRIQLSKTLADEETKNKAALIEAFPKLKETFEKGKSPLFRNTQLELTTVQNFSNAVFQRFKPTMINYAAKVCAGVKFSDPVLKEKSTTDTHK